MKKNYVFGLFVILAFAISSCSKSGNTNKDVYGYTNALTGHTWVYDEYFRYFNDSAATLVYKETRSNNSFDLTLNQVTYNSDGTYKEIDQNGQTYNGTWSFVNNGKGLQVKNSIGTFVSTIQVLTNDRFEWLGPEDTYGVMVSPYQAVGNTSLLQLLTSSPWVYDEVFYDYLYDDPWLVWKPNKENNAYDLSHTEIRFNSNGTYSQSDENGEITNGTWTFLDNGTRIRVVGSNLSFVISIENLTKDRFEWMSIDGYEYAEMVH